MSTTIVLLLAAATLGWLAVPLIAHAATPGETTVPVPTIDTNGDGKPDAWDRDGDGRADAWDRDGDGKPDTIDEDGDGKPDPAQPTKQSPDKPEPQGRN
jgi:hypothetical protein